MATSENIALVRRFIASWSTLDIDQIVEFFADDGIYHNMPIAPVQGKAALRPFIAAFINGWSATDWDILHIIGAGDIVIAERLDRTQVGDKKVDLPCCGVFELRDGKIALWRDYFDMATYRNALA